MTLSDLVATIDSRRQHGNLSSAVCVFVLEFFMSQPSNIKRHDRMHAVTTGTLGPFSLDPGRSQ